MAPTWQDVQAAPTSASERFPQEEPQPTNTETREDVRGRAATFVPYGPFGTIPGNGALSG